MLARAHRALPTLQPRGMLGFARPFNSSSTACARKGTGLGQCEVLQAYICRSVSLCVCVVYQVIPTCYSQGERWVSTPEEVCAGSVGEEEGYHLAGILQITYTGPLNTTKYCEQDSWYFWSSALLFTLWKGNSHVKFCISSKGVKLISLDFSD